MEDNSPTLAQYFVEQACPDNRFLEEMNNVIPWWEIENWFNKEVVKKNSKVGRPAYPIIMMFKIHRSSCVSNNNDVQNPSSSTMV